MESVYDIENYLNSKVNVDENPHDNFYLYSDWLCREKKICDISHDDFGKDEYLEEYIKHMHNIGWFQPVNLPDPIPLEELEKQIDSVIQNFGNTENILYEIAGIEGRSMVAHRTIREWPSFIGTVIFGKDYDPIKLRFNNFKYGNGKEQILRWAALFYIHSTEEE
jgi:hypothetical protein